MSELVIKRTVDGTGTRVQDGNNLLELARGWLKQGNPIVALELLECAMNSRDAEKNKELRAKVLKESARAKMMQSDWDEADFLYLEAQRLFNEMLIHKGAAECARNRANLYFQKGMYQQADQFCEQALEFASFCNDHELRATILNTKAAIKSATGDLVEALKTFKLCLSDFQAAGNASRQGYVLLNIGLTLIEMNEFSDAIQRLDEALLIALGEKDLHLVEICYQNISKCYLEQKETSLAKSVIDSARKFLPGLNSKALEAELNLLDGKILRVLGHFRAASDLLEENLTRARELDLKALQADIVYEQGLLSKDIGSISNARAKIDSAAKQYKQLGMEKNFKQAVQILNQFERTSDALQHTTG